MAYKITLPLIAIAALSLSACGDRSPAVPVEYLDRTLLDRHQIDVIETAETVEIVLDQNASELSLADKHLVRRFVHAYKDRGHGDLVMLLPEGTPNQQFAVGALAEIREIAFAGGVNYDAMAGGSKFGTYPSIILSFRAYEALRPDCKGFGEVDVANLRTNADLPNLGCSVRTNLAAMIADPADLLGLREIGPPDTIRRQATFDAYREGEATASERNDGESGAVSDAVASQ